MLSCENLSVESGVLGHLYLLFFLRCVEIVKLAAAGLAAWYFGDVLSLIQEASSSFISETLVLSVEMMKHLGSAAKRFQDVAANPVASDFDFLILYELNG